MKTKIFCDIAELQTIKKFNKKSIVKGFTTNPSLMRKAGARDYKQFSKKILRICKNKPVSLEVFADEYAGIKSQAIKIDNWAKNKLLYNQALINLDQTEQDEINKLIESYKNDLYSFNYKEKIVKALMDTIVPDTSLTLYYLMPIKASENIVTPCPTVNSSETFKFLNVLIPEMVLKF